MIAAGVAYMQYPSHWSNRIIEVLKFPAYSAYWYVSNITLAYLPYLPLILNHALIGSLSIRDDNAIESTRDCSCAI